MRRLLLPLLLLATDSSAQGYKAIKDWVGACDNTRHCTALGLSAESAENYAVLHFERGPAPGDLIAQIRLRVDHPMSRDNYWIIDADDHQLLALNDAHLVAADGGEGIDILIVKAVEIAAVMGALRSANALTVIGDGGAVGSISLSGASAVMLWIDEQQQRLGTVTALVRRGDKAAATIATPPTTPTVAAKQGGTELTGAELAALSTRVRATLDADSCEEPNPDSPLPDSAWRLPDGRTLVQLTCYAGAYNFGSSWFLVAGAAAPVALSFPVPTDEGRGLQATADLVNASFDPETGKVDSFSKGRGIGDCGSSGSWAWDGQGFQLAAYSQMSDCRGVGSDLWPVLYQSR